MTEEEILGLLPFDLNHNGFRVFEEQDVKNAIKYAKISAIKICAERAKSRNWIKGDGTIGSEVDRQSILSLIDEI